MMARFDRHSVCSALGIMTMALASATALTTLPAWAENAGLTSVFSTPPVGSKDTVDHNAWDGLLKRYVQPGSDGLNRVDYSAFKIAGQSELKSFIKRLENADPRTLDRTEQFALLANLYNAETIDVVLDHYPVKSIKDISLGGGLVAAITGGPWKAPVLKIAGVDASLDDIEHGVLRPVFKDPRVHYAINCASVGCPNLGTEAFTSAKLDQQLDAAARAYINQSRGVEIVDDGLVVSSIYSWFQIDFGGNEQGVLQHIARFAAPPLAAKLKSVSGIDDYAYDWSLNDIKH